MNSVINENNLSIYISESQLVDFICKNSDMEWNDVCDYVRNNDLCSIEGKTFYDKENLEEANEWIINFFIVHPFLNKVVFVFDD